MIEKEMERAVDLIKNSSSFLLTCHVAPDADALGSVLAMGLALESLGKNVEWYNQDGPPASLEFLPSVGKVKRKLDPNKHYDVVMTGDSGDLSRLGKAFGSYKNFDHLINVDHHLTNTAFGTVNVIDIKASSTGSVMLKIIEKAGIKLTPEIAECIYVTLVTDTGSFQYRNTYADTFSEASQMVSAGVNPGDISEHLFFSFPAEKLLLLQRVLTTLKFELDNKYASIVLFEKDLKELNASREIAEGFIDHPRSIKSVRVASFFKQAGEDRFKLSMRSKDKDVDVSKICGHFGGGGHFSASGCMLEGTLEEVQAAVFEQVQKVLGKI